MKREWLLLLGSVTVTVLVAVVLIRWLAPQLLGAPPDMRLVSVSDEVPPFYEGVFRREDYVGETYLLKDPYTRVRARPLFPRALGGALGPNDLLGFRNLRVPDVADVVVIGDSQTYGNNATLEQSWPTVMRGALAERAPAGVYSMATGGWGAVQYFYMFTNATLFRPRVVLVAFYTGNDPLESFSMAYGVDRWASLRLDPGLSASDAPAVPFPPAEDDRWQVTFRDGVRVVFTPIYRYLAGSQPHPAVDQGYEIMLEVARRIAAQCDSLGVQAVFTVIPTKELVYTDKVAAEGLSPPEAYRRLVAAESARIDFLAERLGQLGARYVDVVAPLKKAALGPTPLYPPGINGHPVAAGYAAIGRSVASTIEPLLPPVPSGVVAVRVDDHQYELLLARPTGVWRFAESSLVASNGWVSGRAKVVSSRDFAGLRRRGVITTVDPERYGPTALARSPRPDHKD